MADTGQRGEVRAIRERLGLTQAQIAARLGVSFATVNRWENGSAKPSRLALGRIRDLASRAEDLLPPGEIAQTRESTPEPVPDFRGDPEVVRLVAEAERLAQGHLFNPSFATEISLIDPLPHQRLAVYEHMLVQPRLRFLLADDAGAGKTIMAGLYIREMLSRRLLRRVLIVPPAGLVSNWERELRNLFALRFRVVRGEDSKVTNPFRGPDSDLVIVSVDTLSSGRTSERFQEPGVEPYDLAVFDEAHKLSADRGTDFRFRKTDRYELAERVSRTCRHFLLMTATPHMGKEYPYYCLWRLLEPDVLSTIEAFNRFPADARARHFLRRAKEEMVYLDGRRIYPQRECRTPKIDPSEAETQLYTETSDYLDYFYNQARILNRSAARLAKGVFQRRLASSTYALLRSFERRLGRLDELIQRLESKEVTEEDLRRFKLRKETDPFEDGTGDEEEAQEGLEQNEAVERDILAHVVATSLPQLREERRRVESLRDRARGVFEAGEDSKFEKLRADVLQAQEFRSEKVLVFTEHRDTADFLVDQLEGLGLAGQVARIDGTMSTLPGPSGLSERDEQVEFFRKASEEGGARIMVATDAAGEGINLQFCWLMVNYDIPWNPARLEQRMGRLHRYRQHHDPVVVLNLVARGTREGNVLLTLLEKLEKIRKELRSDKVFDVIGLQFEGKPLRDIILRAIEGDEEGAIRDLEGILTPEQVHARTETRERLLKTGGDVKAHLPRVKAALDREDLRRLLPGYVRRFIERSAPRLGVIVEGDLDGRFALRHLPWSALTALEGYPPEYRSRLSVYRPADAEKAVFLHPGEPVYEGYRKELLGRLWPQASRGAVFVDPCAEMPYLFYLISVSVERKPDPDFPEVFAAAETRSSALLGFIQTADGDVKPCPVEHLLLLRGMEGASDEPPRWAARMAGLRETALVHLDETVLAAQVNAEREALLSTLPEREEFLRSGFDFQEADLAAARAGLTQKAREGDRSAGIELRSVKEQQEQLPGCRERAFAVLHREPELIAPGEIRLVAVALVVPSKDPEDRKRHDREVEMIAVRLARAFEEQKGARVIDVSTPDLAVAVGLDPHPGFDLLSRRPDGSELCIEVKGRQGGGEVDLTENEWARAANLRNRYWLYVVYDCGTPLPRQPRRVRDPFACLLVRARGGVVIEERAILDAAEQEV